MTKEELTAEENYRLNEKTMIPTFTVLVFIVLYFTYLMYVDPLRTLWDFVLRVGLLLIFMPYTVAMVTYEILYSRKTKKIPNVKRFVGRMLLAIIVVLSLIGFLAISQISFSSIIGEGHAGTIGIVLCMIFFYIVAHKFRYFVTKLTEGEW